MISEQPTPLFIQVIAVGLQRVMHTHMIPVETLLQLYGLPEEVNSPQSRFSPLEGKANLPFCLKHDLFHQTAQRLLRHHPV